MDEVALLILGEQEAIILRIEEKRRELQEFAAYAKEAKREKLVSSPEDSAEAIMQTVEEKLLSCPLSQGRGASIRCASTRT